MKCLKFLVRRNRLILVVPIISLCTSGCATPLIALGTGAAGAGMQALGGVTGAAGMKLLGAASSTTPVGSAHTIVSRFNNRSKLRDSNKNKAR